MKLNYLAVLVWGCVFILGLPGCDSSDADDNQLGGIRGDWILQESDPEADLFTRVTDDEVIIAGSNPSLDIVVCSTFQIQSYNPDTGVITLIDADGDVSTSTMQFSGDELIIDGDRFLPSDEFPACTTMI